jgi:hypothetical protein
MLLHLHEAFRQKIRKDALEQYSVSDEEVFKDNLKLGREIADFLRKNIVQAERLRVQHGGENRETYSTCIVSLFTLLGVLMSMQRCVLPSTRSLGIMPP